jgi:ribosome-binding protein aMBF1 (putative translation factor)
MEEQELRFILSQNIKQHRAWNKLSQMELAEKIDISTNFLSDIERCKTWVSPLTLVKLAHVLNIEPYELLKGNHKTTRKLSKEEKIAIENYADDTFLAIKCAFDNVRNQYLPN